MKWDIDGEEGGVGKGRGLVQEPQEHDLGWMMGDDAASEERYAMDCAMSGRAEERSERGRRSIGGRGWALLLTLGIE